MDKWQQVADTMWEALLSHIRTMRSEGYTLQQIADRVGVNNKSVIGEWLNGHRKALNAPFSTIMSYMENVGLDYTAFFPGSSSAKNSQADLELAKEKNRADELEKEIIKLRKEQSRIDKLEQEIAKLRKEKFCAQGEIAALERQLQRLAPTPHPIPSNMQESCDINFSDVTQTSNKGVA